MRVKLSELKRMIKTFREDYAVGADDNITLSKLDPIHNNKFTMKDQTTMTKVANGTINLNPVDSEDEDVVDAVVNAFVAREMGEAKKNKPKQKKDNFGNSYEWSVSNYAKDCMDTKKKKKK